MGGKRAAYKDIARLPAFGCKVQKTFGLLKPHDPFLVTHSSQKNEVLGDNKDMLTHMKK